MVGKGSREVTGHRDALDLEAAVFTQKETAR